MLSKSVYLGYAFIKYTKYGGGRNARRETLRIGKSVMEAIVFGLEESHRAVYELV